MRKSGRGDGVSRSDDAHSDEGDSDPEVTVISRKLDTTGDTLGAIQALQQLIIERTGAIPVITPITQQPAEATAVETSEPEIDWSLPTPPRFVDEPGFSAWIDPDAIAAAYDARPVRSYSDVSTQVFAVFSAPSPEPEPEPSREVQPPPAPLGSAFGSLDVTPPREHEDTDDDVVDDSDGAALEGLAPLASVPPPATGPVDPQPPARPQPEERGDDTEPPTRRRFWLFGRR